MSESNCFYEPRLGHALPHDPFNAIVGFSSIGYKDSVRNMEASGEFIWKLVTRPLAEAMPAGQRHL